MKSIKLARPYGLTFVIVLGILVGLLSVIGGILSFVLRNRLPVPQGLGFLQFLAPVFPFVMIALGLCFFILCYGLWRGYAWSWTMTIVFEIVQLIANVGFLASRGLAIDKLVGLAFLLIILYYLTRLRVRAYFGKGGARTQYVSSETKA